MKIINIIADVLLIFGIATVVITVAWTLADLICVGLWKFDRKKERIKRLLKTQSLKICIELLVSCIGYLLRGDELKNMRHEDILLLASTYILWMVLLLIRRIYLNYKQMKKKALSKENV